MQSSGHRLMSLKQRNHSLLPDCLLIPATPVDHTSDSILRSDLLKSVLVLQKNLYLILTVKLQQNSDHRVVLKHRLMVQENHCRHQRLERWQKFPLD